MTPTQTSTSANRENDQPRAEPGQIPMWLIVFFTAVLFWSMLFLDSHAGGFDQQVYAPFESHEEVVAMNPKSEGDEQMAMGKEVFDKTCTACHQPTGLGKEGTAPPLVGSEWVMADDPARIAHVVLNGLTGPITVKGKEWNLTMVPWKDSFDDKHLAAVLTYVRNTWGNKAPAVKAEALATARKDVHPGPMTAPELLAIPLK
jgi:mono/diheme cytochrome c family protein